MRRTYCYFIRGQHHEWAINVELTPQGAADMRADGIELGEVWYGIPDWIVVARLASAWMFVADIFHL